MTEYIQNDSLEPLDGLQLCNLRTVRKTPTTASQGINASGLSITVNTLDFGSHISLCGISLYISLHVYPSLSLHRTNRTRI